MRSWGDFVTVSLRPRHTMRARPRCTLSGVPDAPHPSASRHGLDDLYDIARLADRLGVEHATIRVWLSRKVPWLPQPDGRLNGGAVWRAETLVGVEDRRRPGRPGPKPREAATGPGPVSGSLQEAAPRPATGPVPVVAMVTGAIAAVAAVTGGIPAVQTTAGDIPQPAAPPDGD